MKKRNVHVCLTIIAVTILVAMLMPIYSNDKSSTDFPPFVSEVKVNPHNTNELYARVDGKLYRSDNNGETWIRCEIDGLDKDIGKIAFDPVDNIVYVGTYEGSGNSLFMGHDGGNWVKVKPDDKFGGGIDGILIQPTDQSKIIYITTTWGNYVRTDGHTWKKMDAPDFRFVRLDPVALDPADPAIVYFSMTRNDEFIIADGWDGSGIYKSNDYGKTLKKIVSARTGILLISPSDNNVMYGVDRDIILKSVDRGVSWKKIHKFKKYDSRIYDLAVNPVDHNILYCHTRHYFKYGEGKSFLYKSIDGGKTWREVTSASSFIDYIVPTKDIAIDPSNPDVLYIGVARNGIFKSTDAGKTWKSINKGIEKVPRKPKN
jgi:photosystem II stability/assembly factor-like uncharacterized protein